MISLMHMCEDSTRNVSITLRLKSGFHNPLSKWLVIGCVQCMLLATFEYGTIDPTKAHWHWEYHAGAEVVQSQTEISIQYSFLLTDKQYLACST